MLSSIDSCIIGKYNNYYWVTGSEGELYYAGQEIQNLPSLLLNNIGDNEDRYNYFKNVLNVDYNEYIQKYKEFCKLFSFEYKEDLELIETQSEEFK